MYLVKLLKLCSPLIDLLNQPVFEVNHIPLQLLDLKAILALHLLLSYFEQLGRVVFDHLNVLLLLLQDSLHLFVAIPYLVLHLLGCLLVVVTLLLDLLDLSDQFAVDCQEDSLELVDIETILFLDMPHILLAFTQLLLQLIYRGQHLLRHLADDLISLGLQLSVPTLTVPTLML